MSAPKRRPIEWLADQMVIAALHHPSVPSEEGFSGIWKNVRIDYRLLKRNPNEWKFSYGIELLSGEIVDAYATIRINPDYMSVPTMKRRTQPSVFPVSVYFQSFFEPLKSKYSFACSMQDGHLELMREVAAEVC